PNYANAYYNRGLVRDDLGDKQGAIEDYNQAAKLYQQQGKNEDYQDALNTIRKLQQ
ncbi:tetratricopeptide repeat protein, partial [Anabaena sp. AL09]|uniref:tetratricopeptide repeat protein n=1 Tax=Anabaena sp. AL09 TaxID=1710891 RepID=UPI0026224F6D